MGAATIKSLIFLRVTSRAEFAGSVALRGSIVQFERLRECPNDQAYCPRSHLSASRFDAEIIELCFRWYITYRLSYRDLVAMMAERGIAVSHTTVHRWVIRYVPEFGSVGIFRGSTNASPSDSKVE